MKEEVILGRGRGGQGERRSQRTLHGGGSDPGERAGRVRGAKVT